MREFSLLTLAVAFLGCGSPGAEVGTYVAQIESVTGNFCQIAVNQQTEWEVKQDGVGLFVVWTGVVSGYGHNSFSFFEEVFMRTYSGELTMDPAGDGIYDALFETDIRYNSGERCSYLAAYTASLRPSRDVPTDH